MTLICSLSLGLPQASYQGSGLSTGIPVALKLVYCDKDESDRQRRANEAAALAQLVGRPHICQ